MIAIAFAIVMAAVTQSVSAAGVGVWNEAQQVLEDAMVDAMAIPPSQQPDPALGVKLMSAKNVQEMPPVEALAFWRSVYKPIDQLYAASGGDKKRKRVRDVNQRLEQQAARMQERSGDVSKSLARFKASEKNSAAHTGPLSASTQQERSSYYETTQTLTRQIPVGPRSLMEMQDWLYEQERKYERFLEKQRE